MLIGWIMSLFLVLKLDVYLYECMMGNWALTLRVQCIGDYSVFGVGLQ